MAWLVVLRSLVFCLTVFLTSSSVEFVQGDFTEFRREILEENGTYVVEWAIDYEEQIVQFNVTAQTLGYIGFGISRTGGMTGADIVVGGVFPNGTSYFSDRHGVGTVEPVVDDHQDWNLISASSTGNHTNLVFSRPFDTCDKQDQALTNDTTNFIWAYSSTGDDFVSYHSSNFRGTFTIQPLDPQTPPIDLSKFSKYHIRHKMVMPAKDTTYYCTIHKSPIFNSKHHIVAFEPLLNSTEAKAYTHHYNIFRCKAPEGQDPEEFFKEWIGGEGGECYIPNPVVPIEHCQTMFYNWAVGGRALVLPENIGYPIGEEGTPVDIYMFEIHYNNPEGVPGVEFETGATIYYTNETREHDAGLMVVAHQTSISLTIPPNASDYKTVGHCDSHCTDSFLPVEGINVFANMMHAHLSGRKMKFRQFRDGQELPWLAVDQTYDFEFQQTRPLSKEQKILQGDHLTVECHYDSTWKDGKVVIGGLSSSEEMCQAIFWYYPKAELRDCRSEYPVDQVFQKFGIQSANRSTMYEDAIITAPKTWAGMKYSEVLNTRVNWTAELRAELQVDSISKTHVGVCWTSTSETGIESTNYPKLIGEEYKPENHCDPGQSESLGNKFDSGLIFTFALLIIQHFMSMCK